MAFLSEDGGIGSNTDTLDVKVRGQTTSVSAADLAHYLQQTSPEGTPLYGNIVVRDLSEPEVFLKRVGSSYYFGQLIGIIRRQAGDLVARVKPFSDEIGENLRAELRRISHAHPFFPYLPMDSIKV
ncbi:hypothetical protein HYX08_02340 [Candidatus Woesearchaeota archaeon]|nr:hypothetical protein [Candidatus Woesearchaeota archaeon]